MKNPLSKIRQLPEDKRKIIFWGMMIALTLALSGLYVKYIQEKVAGISMEKTKEEFDIHSLEEIMRKMPDIEIPKIEMPKIDQEMLRELERTMKEMPEETPPEIPEETSKEAPTE